MCRQELHVLPLESLGIKALVWELCGLSVYVCLCVKMWCIFVCMYVGTCLCICVDMGVYMCIHVIICICVLVYFYVLCVYERYKEHTGANVLARRSPRDP